MSLDLWDRLAASFEPKIDYASDPARWITERAHEFAWSIQRRIMEALVDHRRVAVPSCHGVGKSHIASRIAGWWVDTYGDDPTEVFMVTTAPTASQVAAVLWRYIGQLHRQAELPGRINRSPYPQWILQEDLVGFGRKPADYEDSAFQGIHATHTLIIVDEACGILPGLWDQLSSLASNLHARILAIGNPTDPTSYFYTVCQPDSDWHVIPIDGLRTPNMSEQELTEEYPLTRLLMEAEGIPLNTEPVPDKLREKLIHPRYIEERIRDYAGFTKHSHLVNGDDEREELKRQLRKRTNSSPMFLARVRGVFPTDASTGVIPLGWVQQAVNRWHDWDDAGRPEPAGRRVVGVDVAYYGDDETVLAVRQGNVVQRLQIYAKQDTVETADCVHPLLDHPQALAIVDVNGVGAGVYDTLRRRQSEGQIQGAPLSFNASRASWRERRDMTSGEFKFRDDRAASWWRLRELLDPSRGSQLALPDDETLMQELVGTQYKVATGGIIVVESKDEIKKRLKRSTDRADAVIQSVWIEGVAIDNSQAPDVPLDARDGVIRYEGYTPVQFEDLFGTPDGDIGGWELYR